MQNSFRCKVYKNQICGIHQLSLLMTMAPKLNVRYEFYLRLLSKCRTHRERETVMSILCRDPNFRSALKSACICLIENKGKLSEAQRKSLRKHTCLIHSLGKTKCFPRNKLVQTGSGFLPLILPVVASLLGQMITK